MQRRPAATWHARRRERRGSHFEQQSESLSRVPAGNAPAGDSRIDVHSSISALEKKRRENGLGNALSMSDDAKSVKYFRRFYLPATLAQVHD